MKKHAVHMPAYACICLIMLAGQGVGQAQAESVPTGSLHVAALKMRSHDTALDRRALLREKLAALETNETERPPDLVVVPEYTFYKGYTDHPVHIEPMATATSGWCRAAARRATRLWRLSRRRRHGLSPMPSMSFGHRVRHARARNRHAFLSRESGAGVASYDLSACTTGASEVFEDRFAFGTARLSRAIALRPLRSEAR